MSGTSLDGIDISIITTNGIKISDFGPSRQNKNTVAKTTARGT